MDASLDTNVIIHLYKANLQAVLFNRFEKLKVYDFIRKTEMQNHAEKNILNQFDTDVENGKIEIVTDKYLKSIEMFSVFQQHVKDIRILFDPGDLGEVYAISIANIVCLVTDDVKERGPHYTLMRTPDSEIIPFAFYEILFLDFLESRISEIELLDSFGAVCNLSGLDWDIKSKIKGFMRRFWTDPYNESEKMWMSRFCNVKDIVPKARIQKLWEHITR